MSSTIITKLKTTLLILTLSILSNQLIAQTNTGIFFQAVARDNFSNPAKDRKIYVQSSVIQTTPTGTKVLTEEHQATTDATGVFSISIGNGTRVGGTATGLATIDWSKGPFYLNLKVAITPVASDNGWDHTKEWIDMGTTSFGAVPFALYSASSAKVDDKLNTTDTTKMLAIYAKALSVKTLETSLATKLTAADTLTMLAPYAKVAYTIDSSFFKSQLATKLSVADSLNYVTPTQLAAKTFDQTPITNAIATKLNIADSLNYVTPTQLASYNFSSGGNTSSGSTIDTTNLSNRINLKANTSDVAILTTNLASSTASITTNTVTIATNTSDIVIINTNIAANTVSITANTAAVATEATTARAAELALTNNVAANTVSITANTSDIAIVNTNVASNTTSITANATAIAIEAARATAAELILTNNVSLNTSSITSNIASINLKAPLESPTFTGTVTTGAINSGAMSATSVNTPIYASTPQALTDAAIISWNPANGLNASVTLGGNRTLSFLSTLAAGSYGTLVITQDVTGGRTITLPSTTNKVLGSNSTTSIALSEASGATDILNFYYDGNNCFWNIGQGYGINGTTNLSSNVSGKLPVANGGTGAITLTGIVKGNGTSALTAAIAGTDYQAPLTLTTTGTGSATLSGTTLNIPLVASTVNTSTLSGTVALTNGGTGQTTILGIRNALGLSGNGVTIGQQNSGQTNQASDAISIGAAAGNSNQGVQSVAIGYVAGSSGQGANSVSIGGGAGQVSQGANSIAIGFAAGQVSQGTNSIAIGKNSVASANSIAIGNSATTGTYSNSTSIGNGAISTADNTIQLGNTTVSNVKTSGTLTAGTVTYPNTHAGTSGQVLTSLGSGTLTWTTPASGSSSTYTIGLNSSLGGYVVYITPSGKHGIVSEIINQVTGGTIESMYKNINDPNLHSAAGKEFTDWRIPTIWEMNQIFPYKSAIGGFDLNYYYFTSSNFTTSNSGLVIDMGNGGVGSGFTQPLNLRAIRSF